ncbi:MAG: PA0069 family radical SAM protein [Saprospiraceae bacterium]
MSDKSTYLQGRGAQFNPNSPFDHFLKDEHLILDTNTKHIPTHPKTIVNKVDSPDIPLPYSINPYQGCEHGCVYCYARNTHPYWGYSAGLDFEKNILIKENVPQLLRAFLNKKNYQVGPIMISGNTDCYQPAEQKYQLTRKVLEICLEYKQPVGLITKNALVLRDMDIIQQLAEEQLVYVILSITTLEESLRQKLEPRTATILKRLQTVEKLSNANIPVNVMMAPIIPGLTDTEIFKMVKKVKDYGAWDLFYTILRLNGDVEVIFKDWVEKNFPDRAQKILNQTAEAHGGQVNDSRFGTRMKGIGTIAETIKSTVKMAKKKYGLPSRPMPVLDCSKFTRPGSQLSLF